MLSGLFIKYQKELRQPFIQVIAKLTYNFTLQKVTILKCYFLMKSKMLLVNTGHGQLSFNYRPKR